MQKLYRLPLVAMLMLSAGLIGFSPITHAQSYHELKNAYDDGYDDGYEDGLYDCDDCDDDYDILSSGYIGVNGSYDYYHGTRTIDLGLASDGRYNTSADGFNGQLYGGYGHFFKPQPCGKPYLGGEAFIGTTSANHTDNFEIGGSPASVQLNPGMSYGLNIRPGYKLNHMPLTYLDLGVVRTNIEGSQTIGGMRQSLSNWTTGFQYGIGMEAPLYKQFSFRMDFVHTDYASFTQSSLHTKLSPSDNEFKLGFSFHIK